MEDERRFRWVERLFFERRELTQNEWWLGLTVLGLLVIGAFLILWPLMPTIISNVGVAIIDLFSSPPPAPIDPTPIAPTPLASPSPSPSPLPSPAAGG